jgi:replicative DNA helicase
LKEQSLEHWARIKLAYLDPAYSSVFVAISKHYDAYSAIPTFEELELTIRSAQGKSTLAAVHLTDIPEVSLDVAVDALLDQYTQNETIRLLDKFIDKLPMYDSVEVKENLANIVMSLDEKTHTSEGIFTMDNIFLFQDDEELSKNRFFLGINNTFDATLAGVARQEYILIGGKRGSGKSIVANNIMVNQYQEGNVSAFFTIEMTGHETFQRTMSILADVNHSELKKNKLTIEDQVKVVQSRAGMFIDAEDLVEEFLHDHNRKKFEQQLVKHKELKKDNQLVIIDDRALTITALDLHLGKLKAKFGDKFTVAVVDYLNQIVLENGGTFSQFDWQPQVVISKKLKDLARKYDIIMVSPYQIDASGEARFAKGILDAADISLIMDANEKADSALTFKTTKIRSDSDLIFTSPIDWDTLRISSTSIEAPEKKKEERKPSAAKDKVKTNEEPGDVPW